MISRDSLKSFPYVFKSGIASIDITKTYIWVLLKNASFIIISKSDPKQIITNTFQNPEKVKLNEKCKIYASPDEKGCMMLLFNELFYFDMNKPNEIPKQIKLHDPVESKKISCGAWFEEDDYLYFICCTSTGKIFQLSPDSTAFTNYLFNFPEKVIINNIVILSLKQTFVFVFVSTNISADGKIVIFFGEDVKTPRKELKAFDRILQKFYILVTNSRHPEYHRSLLCRNSHCQSFFVTRKLSADLRILRYNKKRPERVFFIKPKFI